MRTFTDAQKLACDISRNIAVTAGAGSGKTSVLVERYLWCLQNNGYQVRRIVAITFTEKAAGEMLGRIRQRIADIARSEIGESERWMAVLEHLAVANIATIHGFCQRILREFPVEARVDPNFQVLDEAGQRLSLIRLIDEEIRTRAEASDDRLRLLADIWSPYGLREALLHLFQFRETSLPWANRIQHEDAAQYLQQITDLVGRQQSAGIQRLANHPHWQEDIAAIRTLIPAGDASKLTSRCLNILDYDRQFRTETTAAAQLLTLKMLEKECRMITPSARWKEDGRSERLKAAFERLRATYDVCIPPFEFQEGLEQSGFAVQQALAEIMLAVHAAYIREKTIRRVLDFDDLQIHTARLLDNPAIQSVLAQRYDYLMVDEFQDTNQLQWEIIRKFGIVENTMRPDAFCIVGDEKQSIYMFRGAEVAVFGDVRRELQQVNQQHHRAEIPLRLPPRGELPDVSAQQKTGEISMAENFRSIPPLIRFFNVVFSHLFLSAPDPDRPYEAHYQELIAKRTLANATESTEQQAASILPHPVELLLTFPPEESSDNPPDEIEEPELVALRIRELAAASVRYADMAILMRTRTRLKTFEEALRQYNIPFIIAGGIGFYQQQEIYDLSNLLRVLADHRQDIALAGVLRSPLFSFSDDQLLFLSTQPESFGAAPSQTVPPLTLWDRLRHHAHTADEIPAELHPATFIHAAQLFHTWEALVDRIPLPHLLRRIFDDTGWYGILASHASDVQCRLNVEKLLDLARTFETDGFQTLSDFVTYLDQLIAHEEREGEAQINVEGINAVRVMTIHAAKGLEFPIVFVPELDQKFNYGESAPAYLDTISLDGQRRPVLGIKGLHPDRNDEPEDTVLRAYLKRLNAEKTDAEMKRLLYVACTRARDHLVLSGTWSAKVAPDSWLAWLNAIFPFDTAIAEQGFPLDDDLFVPIFTQTQYHTVARSDVPRGNVNSGHSASRAAERPTSDSDAERRNEDVITILRQNLTPLRGYDNEIRRISPSTIHLLFQCPRKYYYQEILKLPDLDPETPPENEVSPSYGRERGTEIHHLFERRFFDQQITEAELRKAARPIFDARGITEQKQQAMGLMEAVIQAYHHYRQSGLRDLLTRSPNIYREYPFYLRIGRIDIAGTLDVLFFDPERQIWTILDYKSNEVPCEQIPEEIARHGYDVQMQLYALAVSRILQVECSRSILFFTAPGVLYDAIDLTPQTVTARVEEITRLLAQLTADALPLPKQSALCEACAYQGYQACFP